MSGRIVGEVLDHAPEDLTQAELLTLVAVAEDARDKDRVSTYSDVETLVRRTRLKPGTVRNALSNLCRRALLEPLVGRVQRGGKHQEYKVARLTRDHRNATLHVTGE